MAKKDSIKNIAEILSGERVLREKEEKMKEEKRKAIQAEKDLRRAKIVNGEVQLEEDSVQKREVVQNIKLFEWKAPERFEIKLNSKGFIIILTVSLLFIVLLTILGKYFLIAAIISMLFVLYAAGTTKPLITTHKVTKRGIDTAGKLYEWYMLDSFYITKKDNFYGLLVNTKLTTPKMLIMLVKEKDKDPLFVILQKHLLYEEIRKQGKMDKITYGEYIPLEKL